MNHPRAPTNSTITTTWIKPSCTVTGPYQKWVSLYPRLSISSTSAAAASSKDSNKEGNRQLATLPATSAYGTPCASEATVTIGQLLGPGGNIKKLAMSTNHTIMTHPSVTTPTSVIVGNVPNAVPNVNFNNQPIYSNNAVKPTFNPPQLPLSNFSEAEISKSTQVLSDIRKQASPMDSSQRLFNAAMSDL